MHREFPENNMERKITYLIIWVVLFLIVAVYILSSTTPSHNNKNNNTTNEVESTDVEDKTETFRIYEEKLLNSYYDFTYTLKKVDETIIYSGHNHGNIIDFTREDINGLKRYNIEDDILYELSLGTKNELDITVNHETYLDLDYLFSKIKEISYVSPESYIITLEFGAGNVNIANENIKSIELTINDETYLLEFDNIEQINENKKTEG